MDWQICQGLALDWSKIIRLAFDWQIGHGLADCPWIGRFVMDWQIGHGLASDWCLILNWSWIVK